MKTNGTRARMRLAAVAATVAAAAIGSAPASADVLNCDSACSIHARTSTMTVDGVGNVNTWVFSTDTAPADTPSIAGTQIEATAGSTVNLTVYNDTPVDLRFTIPQQVGFSGGGVTIPAGGSHPYTFVAKAGTSLYEAGPGLPATRRQIAMGLYGAFIGRPTTTGQAYADATTAYDNEQVLVLSDLDPILNNLADPSIADIHASVDHPHYWLINGSTRTPDLAVDPLLRRCCSAT